MLNKHITKIFFAVLFLSFGLGTVSNPITPAQAADAAMVKKYAEFKQQEEQRLQKEIVCMARNIYFESGSEPYRGKIAVAQVTMNRVQSGDYPSTVCGVVHQKSHNQGITVCQFSWVCEGNLKIRAPELYAESLRVARRVMLDGVRLPELRGAKFFHATYVNPGWKRSPKAKIGNHIFY
jgi:spore germination cell wall hydrolase CwlJ-like protein